MMRVPWLLEVFLICHDWDSVESIFNACIIRVFALPQCKCYGSIHNCGSTNVNQVIFNVVFVAELVLRLRSVGIRLAAS